MFVNNYVYALATFAHFASWLQSLSHKPDKNHPTWLITFDPLKHLHSSFGADVSTEAATQSMLTTLKMAASKAGSMKARFTGLPETQFKAFRQSTYDKLAIEID
ncbi:hypothetical protein DL93DRAFT_2173272 [Clavulina sp. PMI_390]|nr:hypothetical protein DL93DRAFT_2173272 [Clavulina sp. PMI_390]